MIECFIISGILAAQNITLNQPDGGEKWKLGDTEQIRWIATGLSNNMRVLLLKDGAVHGTIAGNVVFDPTETNYSINWPVGTHTTGTAVAYHKYKIRIKDPEEIEGIRKAGQLVVETLDMIESHIRPGLTTDEINTLVHDITIKNNAVPAPLNYRGFPKSVCTSVNEVIMGPSQCSLLIKCGSVLSASNK